MVIVVVRCGFRDAPETPDAAAPVIADAAVADAPIDAAAVPPDAPPTPPKKIVVCTTARSDAEAKALLKEFDFPFRN